MNGLLTFKYVEKREERGGGEVREGREGREESEESEERRREKIIILMT